MRVGEAAKLTGLSIKAIRYYEAEGLIDVQRRNNGYRDYTDESVERLCVLQRIRSIGFTLSEGRDLLALYANKQRHSAEVKKAVLEKIEKLDRQMSVLTDMRETLLLLAGRCEDDEGAECQILSDLSRPNHKMPFTLLESPNG